MARRSPLPTPAEFKPTIRDYADIRATLPETPAALIVKLVGETLVEEQANKIGIGLARARGRGLDPGYSRSDFDLMHFETRTAISEIADEIRRGQFERAYLFAFNKYNRLRWV